MVTVYSKPNCVQCTQTKKYLDNRGIVYTTIDITEDLEAYNMLLEKDFRSAPVVNAGVEWWAGFQPELLDSIVND